MAKFQVTMVRPPIGKRLDRSISFVVEAGDPQGACRKAKGLNPDLLCAAVKKVSQSTIADIV